jgi:hypothetical protein
MHQHLLNRRSRHKTERSAEKHGLYRRERARHQALPFVAKPKVDYNRKWNESIIRARLAKAVVRMPFRVSTILMTPQLSASKKIISSAVDSTQCSTILASGDASNDASYAEQSTKEVLYAFA